MRILLTGATGFLGSHLLKHFWEAGHQVIILKRSFSDTHRIIDVLQHISVYEVDQCDLTQPFRDHGKIDAVIHTATCYGRKAESTTALAETNTFFPLRLLDAASSFNVGTFYNTDTSLQRYLNFYTLSKKQFMEWGKLFADQRRIRFVNIELEHFYGPGDDDSKFTTYLIRRCLDNVPELNLTPGEQKRDFVYIDDVVSAYHLLLGEAPKMSSTFQVYGLGSGKSVPIREFAEMVHLLTSSRTMLKFGAIPYRENEVMNSKADIQALKALGWISKTSLREGIEKTIQGEKAP